MSEVGRLKRVIWRPVARLAQWSAGIVVGLVSGYAVLKLNLLLAIPFAVVWVCLGLIRPRLVGIAGALVGLGIEWIWLLLSASVMCLASIPPVCGWSLPYGPSWSTDPNAWGTLELTSTVIAVVLVAAGVALTVRLAWLNRRGHRAPR